MTSTIDALKNIMEGLAPVNPSTPVPVPTETPILGHEGLKMLTEAASKKEEYRSILKNGIWMVEFTKVDGTPSVMECTLDPRFLPPGDAQDSGTKAADNPTVLRVFSMDRDAWRSFKVLNVTRIYQRFAHL